MAPRSAKTTATGTAVANWDEDLAKFARQQSEAEAAAAGGNFISFKGGRISIGGQTVPGDAIAVVVVGFAFENAYYTEKYNPDDPRSPDCYAIGEDEKELEPHEQADDPQSDTCDNCLMNEWGSADTGRGKACKNTRRLAVISAGRMDGGQFLPYDEADLYTRQPIYVAKLPVTSVKGWATTVSQVTGTLKRPMWAVYCQIRVEPDSKTQFKVSITPLGNVPNHLLGAIKTKIDEATKILMSPYPSNEDKEEAPSPPPPPTRGRAAPAAAATAAKAPPPARGRKY